MLDFVTACCPSQGLGLNLLQLSIKRALVHNDSTETADPNLGMVKHSLEKVITCNIVNIVK